MPSAMDEVREQKRLKALQVAKIMLVWAILREDINLKGETERGNTIVIRAEDVDYTQEGIVVTGLTSSAEAIETVILESGGEELARVPIILDRPAAQHTIIVPIKFSVEVGDAVAEVNVQTWPKYLA